VELLALHLGFFLQLLLAPLSHLPVKAELVVALEVLGLEYGLVDLAGQALLVGVLDQVPQRGRQLADDVLGPLLLAEALENEESHDLLQVAHELLRESLLLGAELVGAAGHALGGEVLLGEGDGPRDVVLFDDVDQLLLAQFEVQTLILVQDQGVDLIDELDGLVDATGQNVLAHLHPLVNQLLFEVDEKVLVEGVREVDAGLLDELERPLLVALYNEEVEHELVHEGLGNLDFVEPRLPLGYHFLLLQALRPLLDLFRR